MAAASHLPAGSKPRYEILDGLRGVAAVIVVMFNLLEVYSKGVPYEVLNHGYLAVYFFFVLSGFVVGYAYDSRWSNGLTFGNFCKRRIIWLQAAHTHILSAIAALRVVNVCLNTDFFGVLEIRVYAAYTMIGGWSLTPRPTSRG